MAENDAVVDMKTAKEACLELMKHNIGTPTDSQRLKRSLLDKDLILKTITKEQTSYQVADVFFSRWLEREF